MKKSSTSSHGSDKQREAQNTKRDKKLVTFQYAQLNCFMSTSTQRTQKSTTLAKPKCTERAKIEKKEVVEEKEELKNTFSQLRITRRNRGKATSNSRQAFNNSILLLEYQNDQETRLDFKHEQKERRQSPKSEEEQNQMVSDVVNSCMRVITQDTEHSSNPISARYTPRTCTQASEIHYEINHSYSGQSFPMMLNASDAYYYYMKSPVRNKRAISFEQSKVFVISINNIEMDGRTTVMVRNIPNKYTQEMLLKRFEVNHKKKFDFFYLPVDYNNNCNVGYAFINFIHTKFIKDFYRQFHNYKWEKFNSMKVCQVCYARIQGTAQLEHHFENSNVIQQKEKRYRPLIGLKSLTDNIQTLVNKQKEGSAQEEEQQ